MKFPEYKPSFAHFQYSSRSHTHLSGAYFFSNAARLRTKRQTMAASNILQESCTLLLGFDKGFPLTLCLVQRWTNLPNAALALKHNHLLQNGAIIPCATTVWRHSKWPRKDERYKHTCAERKRSAGMHRKPTWQHRYANNLVCALFRRTQ